MRRVGDALCAGPQLGVGALALQLGAATLSASSLVFFALPSCFQLFVVY